MGLGYTKLYGVSVARSTWEGGTGGGPKLRSCSLRTGSLNCVCEVWENAIGLLLRKEKTFRMSNEYVRNKQKRFFFLFLTTSTRIYTMIYDEDAHAQGWMMPPLSRTRSLSTYRTSHLRKFTIITRLQVVNNSINPANCCVPLICPSHTGWCGIFSFPSGGLGQVLSHASGI